MKGKCNVVIVTDSLNLISHLKILNWYLTENMFDNLPGEPESKKGIKQINS